MSENNIPRILVTVVDGMARIVAVDGVADIAVVDMDREGDAPMSADAIEAACEFTRHEGTRSALVYALLECKDNLTVENGPDSVTMGLR